MDVCIVAAMWVLAVPCQAGKMLPLATSTYPHKTPPHSTLRDKPAFAQTWGVIECNTPGHNLMLNAAVLRRGLSKWGTKTKVSLMMFLGCGWWDAEDSKTRFFGPRILVMNSQCISTEVQETEFSSEISEQSLLTALLLRYQPCLCCWVMCFRANKAQFRIIWFILLVKV